MEALRLHQYKTSAMSLSIHFRAATTTLCLRSIFFKPFSTSLPKPRPKIKVTARVHAQDKLKDNWLDSLTCPPDLLEPQNQILQNDDVPLSSSLVFGIDPDVSGAIAVLRTHDPGCSAQVYDSPNLKMLVGKSVRRRMDTKAMVQLLRSFNAPIGTIAYIEQSIPYPTDGKQGWWSGGFNYGLWIGALVASDISVVPVPSQRWKNEFKLFRNGSTKDDCRALACTLFPSLSSSLRRKKDHGRADALLIAAYGKGIRLDSNSALMAINTNMTTN